MPNTTHSQQTLFKILSKLTDEDILNNTLELELYEEFNSLQELTNRKLFELIEDTSFPSKYKFFENINELLLSVQLRMMISELTDKHIFCFYHPDKEQLNWLQEHFLKNIFKNFERNKFQIFNSVPTLLVHSEDKIPEINVFSVGEKNIRLSEDEYKEILYQDCLDYTDCNRIEISGVAHLITIKSYLVQDDSCILVVPTESDKSGKYYKAILKFTDSLILSQWDKEDDFLNNEICENNIKCIMYKNLNQDLYIKDCALKTQICDFIEIKNLKQLDECIHSKVIKYHNFNHRIVLKSYFSEIFWLLAYEHYFLNVQLKQINEDLLNEDPLISEIVKLNKKDIESKFEKSDRRCKNFKVLLESMEEHLKRIEVLCKHPGEEFNDHILTSDDLSAYFYCMSFFYRETNYSNRVTAVRDIQKYCNTYGDSNIANIITNDFFKRTSEKNNLEYLKKYESKNPYIGRLRILHHNELELDIISCGEIVKNLPKPLTPIEQRILGFYLYQKGEKDLAREELFSAMSHGDKKAGMLFTQFFAQNSPDILKVAALSGYAEAALQIGTEKVIEYSNTTEDDTLFYEALKFLNIAAAGKVSNANAYLFNLWKARSEHFVQLYGKSDERCKECFNICLNIGENCIKLKESIDHTDLGIIAYQLEKYKTSMEYLKKVTSAQAYEIRGLMYEQGLGTAKNRRNALNMYEKAVKLGSTKSKVDYDRLFAEIEAEKKIKEANKNANYSATTYYSGFSSYYSGW